MRAQGAWAAAALLAIGLLSTLVAGWYEWTQVQAASSARTSAFFTAVPPVAGTFAGFRENVELGLLFAAVGGALMTAAGWKFGTFDNPPSLEGASSSLEHPNASVRPKRAAVRALRSAPFAAFAVLALLLVAPLSVFALNSIPTERVDNVTVSSVLMRPGCPNSIGAPGTALNISPPSGDAVILKWNAPQSGGGVYAFYNGTPISDWGAQSESFGPGGSPSPEGYFSFIAQGGIVSWYANWPGAPDCGTNTPVQWTISVIGR